MATHNVECRSCGKFYNEARLRQHRLGGRCLVDTEMKAQAEAGRVPVPSRMLARLRDAAFPLVEDRPIAYMPAKGVYVAGQSVRRGAYAPPWALLLVDSNMPPTHLKACLERANADLEFARAIQTAWEAYKERGVRSLGGGELVRRRHLRNARDKGAIAHARDMIVKWEKVQKTAARKLKDWRERARYLEKKIKRRASAEEEST